MVNEQTSHIFSNPRKDSKNRRLQNYKRNKIREIMTKQEKIQEAYGEFWESSKRYVDPKNGTIANKDRNFDIHNGFFEKVNIDGENRFRPKSLQGIENNNGWIKIESEYDLPKEEYELYFVNGNNTNIHQCIYHIGIKEYWLKTFTHYQPIQKPHPPIY
jgi:hypothetical protein